MQYRELIYFNIIFKPMINNKIIAPYGVKIVVSDPYFLIPTYNLYVSLSNNFIQN